MLTMKINIDEQLDLGFQTRNHAGASKTRVVVRRHRARVWFNRMRQVVEKAIDRTPAPTPCPNTTSRINPIRDPGLRFAPVVGLFPKSKNRNSKIPSICRDAISAHYQSGPINWHLSIWPSTGYRGAADRNRTVLPMVGTN
jgi:hypothetical protein